MHSFEWDDKKNEINIKKHGISFETARQLWADPKRRLLAGNTKDTEERYKLIGSINDIVFAGIFTHRGTKIRLISVRKARLNERKLYEEK